LRTTFSKRIAKVKELEATKALEKQLNAERKAAEQVIRVKTLLTQERREISNGRKAAKEEKERQELLKTKVTLLIIDAYRRRCTRN
jgi:hypothetical protein